MRSARPAPYLRRAPDARRDSRHCGGFQPRLLDAPYLPARHRLGIGAVGASFVITQYHTSVMFAPNVVGTANATAAGLGNAGAGVAQAFVPLLVAVAMMLGFGGASAWRPALGIERLAWPVSCRRLKPDCRISVEWLIRIANHLTCIDPLRSWTGRATGSTRRRGRVSAPFRGCVNTRTVRLRRHQDHTRAAQNGCGSRCCAPRRCGRSDCP
ncbi:hypothetical protein PSAC2689_100313 [Paraburkholderia sacchari]